MTLFTTYSKERKFVGRVGQENHYCKCHFTSSFHSPPGLIKSLQNFLLMGTMPFPCKGSIYTGDSEHEAQTLISSLPF